MNRKEKEKMLFAFLQHRYTKFIDWTGNQKKDWKLQIKQFLDKGGKK